MNATTFPSFDLSAIHRQTTAFRSGRRWRLLRNRLAVGLCASLGSVAPAHPENHVGVLMYHRVAPTQGLPSEPTWNVTPERMRAQIGGLLDRGFLPWPLSRVLEHQERRRSVPNKVFVITFDDGYENNLLHALPVLRELHAPATIFLATAFLDSRQPFPFDDWTDAAQAPPEAWRPLTTEQCRELLASGLIELGCHTHTHQPFQGRPGDLLADVRLSLETLRRRLNITRPAFAFPYGVKDAGLAGGTLAEAVRISGARCALTTEPVLAALDGDPYDWGRFTAHQHDTAATLAAKMSIWFSLARGAWRRVSRRDDREARHVG